MLGLGIGILTDTSTRVCQWSSALPPTQIHSNGRRLLLALCSSKKLSEKGCRVYALTHFYRLLIWDTYIPILGTCWMLLKAKQFELESIPTKWEHKECLQKERGTLIMLLPLRVRTCLENRRTRWRAGLMAVLSTPPRWVDCCGCWTPIKHWSIFLK